MKFHTVFLSLCLLLTCKKPIEQSMESKLTRNSQMLTYLALGDSYTIGEAVSQKDCFPFQLVSQLNSLGMKFSTPPKIIAKTGWTTSELQYAIKTDNAVASSYDVVTLLIGVNNQYRGNSLTEYRKEFVELLQTAVSFAGGNKKHVFVASIPDWGVTPFGKASGRDQKLIAQEIDDFNTVNKEETLAMGISYTDITPSSRLASTDTSLIANDGLHPSGKMYAEWATLVAPKVAERFQ
jgi:lysophospholipase L1-like esterase